MSTTQVKNKRDNIDLTEDIQDTVKNSESGIEKNTIHLDADQQTEVENDINQFTINSQIQTEKKDVDADETVLNYEEKQNDEKLKEDSHSMTDL